MEILLSEPKMIVPVRVVILMLSLNVLTSQASVNSQVRQNVEPDPDLENYLREAIENFREQMKNGIPAIKMPVLDPLELQNLDINVNENLANMDLKIKKLNVRCLSIFNVTHLKPNLEELFLGINMTLPEIYVHGQYSVTGRLLRVLPIYGNGDFDINATEISISGVGQLGFTNDTMQMSLLKLDLLWKHLSVFMERFLGGGNFSDMLQKVVPHLGRDIFNRYKPLIMDKFETCLQREINDKLNQPEVKDIIKSIIPAQ